MTYLINSVLVGGPCLVAEIVALEDTARKKTGSGLDHIGSNILFRERDDPGIMARENG